MIKVKCEICNKIEVVSPSRAKSYKTCGHECSSKRRRATPETTCTNCGNNFHMKKYQRDKYERNIGIFCSRKCTNEGKKNYYKGLNNPNYRGKHCDEVGYLIIQHPELGRQKLHRFVVMDYLKVYNLPSTHQVHHRDCNIYNNNLENLVLLTNSDHRWLHKQFGNATLWAYVHGKIDLDTLASWSNDKEKAKRLLPLNILQQTGIFKQGELLETPTLERQKEDNQQPSLDSNILEGSTTNLQIIPTRVGDSNENTSALPFNIDEDGFVTTKYNDITVYWKPIKGFDY